MARLPVPGDDNGVWGGVLNEYLQISLKKDGTLKDNTVTAQTLTPGAVSGSAVQDSSIAESKLSTDVRDKLNAVAGNPTMGGDLSGSASNAQIVAGAVGANELAASAVTTPKLADASITSVKVADGQITEAKLASAVQTKLNSPATLADDSVTSAKINDDAVTETKLSSAVRAKLNAADSTTPANGSLTPVKLNADTPVNGEVLGYNNGDFEWITPEAGGGSGEVNTASNIGTGGIGVFKQKTGTNFEFKTIGAGSNKISVTNDAANNNVDIDVNTANLGLTKTDVGLANVDNTADANKPVSSAVQTALDDKADDDKTVKLTGAQTIAGAKTFSASPIIPTPSADSSDTTAASTAFVKGVVDDVSSEMANNMVDVARDEITTYNSANNIRPIYYIATGDPEPEDAPNGSLLITVDSLLGMEVSLLAEGSSTTNGASVSTASFTPASGAAVYTLIVTGSASAAIQPTSADGHASLTTITSSANGQGTQVARLYRMTGTGLSGTITFDYASSMDAFAWKVVQVKNANVVPVQSNSSSGTSINPTVSLGGASSSNLVLGFFSCNATRTFTTAAGYSTLGTELHQVNTSITSQAVYRMDGTSSVAVTADQSATFTNIAIEVAPA